MRSRYLKWPGSRLPVSDDSGTAAIGGDANSHTAGRRALRARAPDEAGFLGGDRIGELVPAVALAISGGMLLDGFNSAMGQAICCIVNCTALILLLLERPPVLDRWREVLPVLGLLAAAALWVTLVSTIYAPSDPAAPFVPDLFASQMLSFVAGVAALLCGWLLGMRWSRTRQVVDWLIALSCLYLLFGLLLRAIGTNGLLDYWSVVREDRFQGLIGNVNVTAAVAGVTAVLALSRVFTTAARRRGAGLARREIFVAALYCLAVFIALGAAIATASRFTNLLTFTMVALLAGVNLMRNVRQLRLIGALLGAVALAVVVLLTQFSDLLVERMTRLPDGLALRETMWSHYLAIAADAPVTGHGLGSFPTVNGFYLTTPRFAEAMWAVNSAHNGLLQIAINGGVPYLAFILAASLYVCGQILAGCRARWSGETAGIAIAIFLIVACGMIDITLDVPATVTLMLFLAGLLWGAALIPAEILVAGPRRAPLE